MKQPIKKEIKQEYNLKDIKPRVNKSKKKEHPDYNVSKLEDRFAENFLDKLKVKYVRQFEAKDIGRFYDFYLPDSNLIIEVISASQPLSLSITSASHFLALCGCLYYSTRPHRVDRVTK